MQPQNSNNKNNSSIMWNNNILLSEQQSFQTKNKEPIKTRKIIDRKYSDILQQFLQSLRKQEKHKNSDKQNISQNSFKQQWQGKSKYRYQTVYSQLKNRSIIFTSSMVSILILQIFLMWFISVFRVFKHDDSKSVFMFCLLVQIFDLMVKITESYFYKFKHQNITEIQFKQFLYLYGGNLYLILYSILGITSFINYNSLYLLIVDIISLTFCYSRFQEIYIEVRLISFSSKFKSYLRLINLMCTLMVIIHSFAILLYFASHFNQVNYITSLENYEEKQWFQLYVYSFYFACTTVLTVGYGDVLPHNLIEIFIVLLMQIFGVVMIVYLNGQVGNILMALRKQNQNLQNDLSILQKIASNFKLSLHTTKKFKQNLIDNAKNDDQKDYGQEISLLSKVYLDLRQQAPLTDSINVVKNCKFLMDNFSSKTQMLIARKLQNNLYPPNSKFSQDININKLYILKKGEVSLYITRKQNQEQIHRKTLKTIQCNLKSNNNDVCFGFSSLIMGKANKLKTITKSFCNILSIEQKDFVEAIRYCQQDFQKYHQLKTIYLTSKNLQRFQTLIFNNQSDHYIGDTTQIIKKYLNSGKNNRKNKHLRSTNKKKRFIDIQEEIQPMIYTMSQSTTIINKQTNKTTNKQTNKQQSEQIQKKTNQTNKINKITPQFFGEYFKAKNTDLAEVYKGEDPFECSKQYNQFYQDSNYQQVIKKYNLKNNPLDILFNKKCHTKPRQNISFRAPLLMKKRRRSQEFILLKE